MKTSPIWRKCWIGCKDGTATLKWEGWHSQHSNASFGLAERSSSWYLTYLSAIPYSNSFFLETSVLISWKVGLGDGVNCAAETTTIRLFSFYRQKKQSDFDVWWKWVTTCKKSGKYFQTPRRHKLCSKKRKLNFLFRNLMGFTSQMIRAFLVMTSPSFIISQVTLLNQLSVNVIAVMNLCLQVKCPYVSFIWFGRRQLRRIDHTC